MNCLNPQRIYNQSLQRFMYVPCRCCDACLIQQANIKATQLNITASQYPYLYFITLTYNPASVPIVLDGDTRILRGSYPFGEILSDLEKPIFSAGLPIPKKSMVNDCIGVLYYKDLTNFIKRLRIHYERKLKTKFPCKIFTVGEYGSHGNRPHFHILLMSKSDEYKRLLSSVPQNWRYATWSKLDPKKWLEVGRSSISSYLASYVNSLSRDNEILQSRPIHQKTSRSKDISFGVEKKVYEHFKKVFQFGGINSDLLRNLESPFITVDCKTKNAISTRLVPTKVFNSYFTKPRFCNNASFNTFLRCCSEISTNYRYGRKDLIRSSDYLFHLGYRRYLSENNLVDNYHTLENFVFVFWSSYNYYKSQQLKKQMLAYGSKPKLDYYVDLVDSYIDNPTKRFLQLRRWAPPKSAVDLMYHPVSRTTRCSTNGYIEKYKTKLLKKHLANEINF